MSTSELDLVGDSATEKKVQEPPPTGRRPRSLRPLILRLHFYAGVFVGPFIIIAAITGAMYALAPTAERVVYGDILSVDPSGTALSLSEQAAKAQQAYPGLAMSGLRPAATDSESTRIYFTDPTVGEEKVRAIFVNPYSGEVLGSEPTWFGSLPLSTWLDGFHRHLQLGELGRLYSEFAATWLWVVALGGLFLWIGKFRKDRLRGRGRLVGIDRSLRGRARTLNWHGSMGVWVLLGALFLSATGITWSTYAGANVTDLRAAFGWQRPQLDTTMSGGEHAEHTGHEGHTTQALKPAAFDFDAIVASAEGAGVQLPLEVTLPSEPGQAVGVAEIDKSFRLTTDAAAIDPATMRVASRVDYNEDYSLVAKLADWGIRGHMGFLFGLFNQLLLAAVAVAFVAGTVLGYVMWWQRRPARGSNLAVGRPPLRGGIRRVHPVVAVLGAVAMAAIGWFLPMLGIGLVAFLVMDLLAGRARVPSR